jgi:hypothetical protein
MFWFGRVTEADDNLPTAVPQVMAELGWVWG